MSYDDQALKYRSDLVYCWLCIRLFCHYRVKIKITRCMNKKLLCQNICAWLAVWRLLD